MNSTNNFTSMPSEIWNNRLSLSPNIDTQTILRNTTIGLLFSLLKYNFGIGARIYLNVWMVSRWFWRNSRRGIGLPSKRQYSTTGLSSLSNNSQDRFSVCLGKGFLEVIKMETVKMRLFQCHPDSKLNLVVPLFLNFIFKKMLTTT